MPNSKNPKYRVGIIGCGRAGTGRARAFDLHPLCEVVAIADTDPENLALGCRHFNAPGYNSFDEMLQQEQIDIAMPVLPVRPNADAVVASAEAGVKAIFCEKPLTASLEDADRMVEACRSHGIHFAAGLVISSHPDYQKAYELVAAGEIGEIRRIDLYSPNNQGGCHGLNLVRKFAGKAPVDWVVGWVDGDPFSDHEHPYDDAKTGFGKIGGYIRFSNGVECFSNYKEIGWKGIEIIGSEGVIYNWNNTGLGLHLLKNDNTERGPAKLREIKGLFEEYKEFDRGYDDEGWLDPGTPMKGIVQAIVDSLETGAPLKITTGDDLRHALEIAIGLRESHRRGHTPVKFPIEDRTLVMHPQRSRWHYKKDVYGREWYMEQMRQQRRD